MTLCFHRRIRESGIILTAQDALKFSKEVKVVELEVLNRRIKLVTQGISKLTKEIFNLMKINLPRKFEKIDIEKFSYQKGMQRELFY